jgi:hypothetical protein
VARASAPLREPFVTHSAPFRDEAASAPSDDGDTIACMDAVRRLYVVTHRDPAVAGRAVDVLCDVAERVGIELVADPVEAEKHERLADACAIA